MGREDEQIEEIAREALAASTQDPTLSSKVNKLAEAFARREARKVIRELIRPFENGGHPAIRLADPRNQAIFFDSPSASAPNAPQAPSPASDEAFPRTKEERRRYSREFFTLIFRDQNLTLEDLAPSRLRVFYRLVRELARHTRHLEPSQLLSELSIESWTKPLRAQEVVGRYSRTSKLLRAGPDLALLPPPPPEDLTGYDPNTDTNLLHYCASLAALAEDLQIAAGTHREPYLGRYGLKGLLEPELVRLACPTPEEVIDWEDTLAEDTLTTYLAQGTIRTTAWLKRGYGLFSRETLPLLRAAQELALLRTEGDLEQKRAVMQLRLEDLARRSRKAMNLPAELGANKLQALIGGFARVEPENAITEFVQAVKKVNAESPSKQLAFDPEDDDQDEDEKEAV